MSVRLVDCRPRAAYESGHLPDAVHLDPETVLSTPTEKPAVGGRHPLPDPHALAAAFAGAGIDSATFVLAYDEAHWAVTFDYHAHPLEPALATVDAVRANTVALIRRLPESAWTRVGRHTASGRYGAEDWLRIYAAHLEEHAAQIEANVAAWKTRAR